MKTLPPFAATAIGSIPFLDVNRTLDLIAQVCPELPHCPQFVRRRPREDMVLQVVDGLPLLSVDEADRRVVVNETARLEEVTDFYERFLTGDYGFLAVPSEANSGLRPWLDRAQKEAAFGPVFLKAQLCGPVSFSQAVRKSDGQASSADPELVDVIVKGLGGKAGWLADQIRAAGRTPLIFLDEPGLTGYGSAFSTLKREEVLAMIDEVAQIARSSGEIILGVHVCGNTDWGLLTETSLDLINFDAFGFLDHFLLYPRQIKKFIERGGYIGWGLVPTKDFSGNETAGQLSALFMDAMGSLAKSGLDLELIKSRAIITPACGMGTMSEDAARAAYALLAQTSRLIREAVL